MAKGRMAWARKLVQDELAKKLFWSGLWLLAGVIVVIFRWAQPQLTMLNLALIGLVAFLGAVFFVKILTERYFYHIPWYPRVWHHFLVLEKKIVWEIRDDETLHFYRRLRVKALADNLGAYVDKFLWTGDNPTFPRAGEGVSYVEPEMTAGVWTYYRTHFPRVLRKGEEHEFQVDWYINDWRTASPFFSTSTEEPTKRLIFEMIAPEDCLAPGGVYFETMRGIEASYPFYTEKKTPERGRVVIDIQPKIYRHYRLRWAWIGSELQSLPEAESGTLKGRLTKE